MAHTLILPVSGMSCASCTSRVQSLLTALPDVTEASVNLATESAHLTLSNPDGTGAVMSALQDAGYPVVTQTHVVEVENMNCASCVGRIEALTSALPGVRDASANLATHAVSVSVVPGVTSIQDVTQALAKAGYPVVTQSKEEQTSDADDGRRALLIAAALTLPVFVLAMGGTALLGLSPQVSHMIQFLLTSAILLGPGRVFFARGVPALLSGHPDMNSLVAIGTGAAWAFSTLSILAPGVLHGTAVYFETAAVIVTLILLGRYLEARARSKTGTAIRKLMGLAPKTARVDRDGTPVDVPLDALALGDTLIIRPGERVPTDCRVASGESYLDESMMTGEPVPVAKSAGDALVGGTLNGTGSLRATVTATGEATLLAQIIRTVSEAQGAKLPIQSAVDKVTAWFVPAVLVTATVTFLAWFLASQDVTAALTAGIAVLIIACPCAMGLATPTSIMVATGRAAELGVLFRKGDALQQLRSATLVAFDKTGTLTKGHPNLTDFESAPGQDRDHVLALIAAAESASEHPIARAIVDAAPAKLATPHAVTALAGQGVQAQVDNHDVLVGTEALLTAHGVDVSPYRATADAQARTGKTVLFAAIDGAYAAMIAVSDPVKPSTPPAIAALHDLGLRTAMITGDKEATASAIADTLGINTVVADTMPTQKAEAVAGLAKTQDTTVFVGDGINDAPALASADIGIAIGTGTDIAIESADVVLMSGNLSGVSTAIHLSRKTMTNIRQNLFWAFGYNVLLIPVAAIGALSPMLAAGAMALSSVFVVSNALRLRHAKGTSS